MRAALIALTSCALLLAGCSESEPLGEGHYRWEGIDGFAIWPEDQPRNALEWCETASGDPWWRDPGETAVEFARTKLNWNDPPDMSDHDVPEDAPRTSFSMSDGSMGPDSLGVVIHLRQLRGCWFVARVQPREGDIGGTYEWRKKDGEWVLWASTSSATNLEVGWGDTVETLRLDRGEEVEIPTPDPERSGHILWFDDEPSEHTFGQPLSPPPRIP